jgi:predicted transcriptional regulator
MNANTEYPLMAFRLTEDLRAAIAAAAEVAKCSKSAIVREALLQHLILRPVATGTAVSTLAS